jgi:peptidyl-prolyl cis-trans isomerase C
VRSQFVSFLALSICAVAPAAAQALSPDPVVATRGEVSLLLSDLDAGLQKVPEDLRAGYMRDPERVARLVDNLLISKQIATQARKEGLHQEPLVAAVLAVAENELLTREYLQRMLPSPAEEEALEELARQTYRAHSDRFKSEPVWDISYLLASTDGREEADAKALAEELLVRARAGEELEVLIKDATAAQSTPQPPAGGSIKDADLVKMDAAFVTAVKSIKEPGAWSEPVRTRFGYHIARLDRFVPQGVRPFEAVREELITELRSKAQQTARTALIRRFSQQETELNDALIATLRDRYQPAQAAEEAAASPVPAANH